MTEIKFLCGKGESDGGSAKVGPALGAGLRLNLNKAARPNLAIDYAWGLDGSPGLALNLGEVF